MKSLLLIIMLGITCPYAFSQDSTLVDNVSLKDEAYWKNWISDLYEVGVEQTKDSLKISSDVKKIMLDSNYRKFIYPAKYTLPVVSELMKQMEIKKAIWYLINMYAQDKNTKSLVLQIIVPFEQGMEIDKVLISTFYTYAMTDPQVAKINKGKVEISRPDLLEKKFNAMKELAAAVVAQRKGLNTKAHNVVGSKRTEEIKNLGKGNVKKINIIQK